MKKSTLALRIACVSCALLTILSATACRRNKTVTPSSNSASSFGSLTSNGYELPYDYEDGYSAMMKVPEGSEYVTVSTTPGGNKVLHFTTTKSVDEVNDFYQEYFDTLVEVKAKKETDSSVGYFDEEARLILFNLNVWVADGKTNYKLGTEACEKIEDSELWEKK